MADLNNHPIKVTIEKGWLRKKLKDIVVTNYSYGMSGNSDNVEVTIYDGKFNIIHTCPIALSMQQFFSAQSAHMGTGEIMDLTADGLAAIQKRYSHQNGKALYEGDIKQEMRLNTF